MTDIKRLVSYAEAHPDPNSPEQVSISVRLDLELADGRRVLLLNDRGWGSSACWAELTLEQVRRNARKVVGPDEPPKGRSHEEEAALHWAYLQRIAQRQGALIDADELRRLPHDVEISEKLLARMAARASG